MWVLMLKSEIVGAEFKCNENGYIYNDEVCGAEEMEAAFPGLEFSEMQDDDYPTACMGYTNFYLFSNSKTQAMANAKIINDNDQYKGPDLGGLRPFVSGIGSGVSSILGIPLSQSFSLFSFLVIHPYHTKALTNTFTDLRTSFNKLHCQCIQINVI